MPSLIGNKPNQVSTNGDLGTLAFQDSSNVLVGNINATGVASVQAGTVSAPSITTTGDTNTGIFFPAADTIAFTEGGVEAMRIDSAGNVGIGKTNPDIFSQSGARALVVSAASSGAPTIALESQGSWSSAIRTLSTGSMVFYNDAFTERMRITSAGNVGIGTSSPDLPLTISKTNAGGTGGAIRIVNPSLTVGTRTSLIFTNTTTTTFNSARIDALRDSVGQNIVFSQNDTERMRLDSSGNLGLGVTPSAWASDWKALEFTGGSLASYTNLRTYYLANAYSSGGNFLYKATGFASSYLQLEGKHTWFTAPSGTAGNTVTFTQAMTLDASGNLGIGTTSPNAQLTVFRAGDGTYASNLAQTESKAGFIINPESNGSSVKLNFAKTVGGDGVILQSTNGSASGAYNVVINPFGGDLLVGCAATPSASVKGSGFITNSTGMDLYFGLNTTSSDRVVWFYNPNGLVGGIVLDGSSTIYSTSSDYRLKENVAPMTGALAKVAQLKPVTYNWKVDGSSGEGFIAHELQEVIPNAVNGEKDALNEDGSINPQGIDTSFLVATLTAAIQELKAEVDALKAQINQ